MNWCEQRWEMLWTTSRKNEEVDLQFHEDRPIGVILPNTVVLKVTDTAL